MRYATRLIATLSILAPFAAAGAPTIAVNGLVDFGVLFPSNQRSVMQGGLGKLEFGGGNGQALEVSGQALADLRAIATPSLGAYATVRVAPDQHVPVDVLEAYARYQPVMTSSWVWTLKGGAFFPPISLENEGIGWTSPWTLTSSAINSWVGDELRTIGGETSVEWRHATGSIRLVGGVYGANDPTGALLADRGWTFDSRPIGLLGEPRVADAVARQQFRPIPAREEPFKEIDGWPGYYVGASLRQDGIGRIEALYYDNRADPGAFIGADFGWRTRFTSLGAELDIGDVVLLSQGMIGHTTIEPFEEFYSTTDFQSAYLLAGYYFDDFRIAGRFDVCATQQVNSPGGRGVGEHGYAVTLAGTWMPRPWLRLTAEMLRVESSSSQRASLGGPARAADLQLQVVGRVLF